MRVAYAFWYASALMTDTPPQARSWSLDHLGAVLSLGYVALTLIGMLYSWAFYYELGVNILTFAEASDFLLAPVRDPLVIALATAPVPLFLLFRRALRRMASLRGRTEWWVKFVWPTERYYGHENAWFLTLVILYATAFTMHYADYRADRLRDGHGRWVTAHYATATPGAASASADSLRGILAGTTSNYVFLYEPAQKTLRIVPVEHLDQLTLRRRVRTTS